MSEATHSDIVAALGNLSGKIDSHLELADKRLEALEEHVKREWTCPYYPERGENGHSVNSRLAAVEDKIDRDRVVRRFVVKVVAGAGAVVAAVLGIVKAIPALQDIFR